MLILKKTKQHNVPFKKYLQLPNEMVIVKCIFTQLKNKRQQNNNGIFLNDLMLGLFNYFHLLNSNAFFKMLLWPFIYLEKISWSFLYFQSWFIFLIVKVAATFLLFYSSASFNGYFFKYKSYHSRLMLWRPDNIWSYLFTFTFEFFCIFLYIFCLSYKEILILLIFSYLVTKWFCCILILKKVPPP